MSKIARRYAKALLDLSGDGQESDFSVLEELFDNKEAQKALLSPIVSLEVKEGLVTLATQRLRPEERRFFGIVVQSKRVHLIPSILSEFRQARDQKLGVHNIKITTVSPLSNGQAEDLRSALSAIGKMRLDFQTDSSLLGGIRLETNNKVLDLSLKTKLNAIIRSAQKG